jgi:hypothetical protein
MHGATNSIQRFTQRDAVLKVFTSTAKQVATKAKAEVVAGFRPSAVKGKKVCQRQSQLDILYRLTLI